MGSILTLQGEGFAIITRHARSSSQRARSSAAHQIGKRWLQTVPFLF